MYNIKKLKKGNNMDKQYLEGSPFEPVKLKKSMKKPFSHAGFIGFTFLCISAVISFFVVAANEVFGLGLTNSTLSFVLACMQYIAYPVCLLTTVTMPKTKPEKHKVKLRYILAAFAVCIPMMYAGIYASNYLSEIIDVIFHTGLSDTLEESLEKMSVLQTFITTAVFAPVFEELIFRKLPLDRIRGYGDGPAVFISALVFGLIHCNLFQFFYAFAIGMVFGYVYVKTGKIIYTILLHSAVNIFGGVIPAILNTQSYADIRALIKGIMELDFYAIGTLAYMLITYALIIGGIVLIAVLAKKVKHDFKEYAKDLGAVLSPACINCGMIFVYVVSLLVLILNQIALK